MALQFHRISLYNPLIFGIGEIAATTPYILLLKLMSELALEVVDLIFLFHY